MMGRIGSHCITSGDSTSDGDISCVSSMNGGDGVGVSSSGGVSGSKWK